MNPVFLLCIIYFYNFSLNEVLTYAEDMVIDIQMMWPYLAQLIAPMLVGGTLPMAKFVTVLKAAMEKLCCSTLLAQILLQVKEKLVSTYSIFVYTILITALEIEMSIFFLVQ